MKAQFWSIDMIFSIIILTTVIAILSIVWISVSSQYSTTYGYGIGSMQAELAGLIRVLQTTGQPQNWNSAIAVNSVGTWGNMTLGLQSGSSGMISTSKIAALEAMTNTNYQATKQHFGVSYDYYITFSIPNQYNLTIGKSPFINNATAIQSATIPVTLDNGQAASMRIMVWTNTSFGVG